MPMERLHILVPKGTIKRAKKAAKHEGKDTHSEWIREIIGSAIQNSEDDRMTLPQLMKALHPNPFVKTRGAKK